MKKIYALTDYKNCFGSKWKAIPYRSGFDKILLKKYLEKYGYDLDYIQFHKIDVNESWKGRTVIYTSSEEVDLNYKDFIEDVVYSLELIGAETVPKYKFLRANNNKVFMELLRKQLLAEEMDTLQSSVYGTFEELMMDVERGRVQYPCVIKKAAGAMSKGVFLAKDKDDLILKGRKVSRSPHYLAEAKEIVRVLKHKGYRAESKYQQKFIVQPFVPGLQNDWKILVFGDHYYVLRRGVKENDFRASGSGFNYKGGAEAGFPVELLDQIEMIYNAFNVPHLSLDFAFDGDKGYLIEYQAVYFGTATMDYSSDFYIKKNGVWAIEQKTFDQEGEFAWGLAHFLDQRIG